MKSATTGTVSGCVAWMLVFCVLSICVLSVGPLVGILIPEFNKDFVANTLGPYLCPPESTAKIVTRQIGGVRTTSSTMQCVDSNGNVVKEPDLVLISFGIIAVIVLTGLILSALIAVLLAAPAGVFIAYLSNRLLKAYNARKMKGA